ncbi:MAG: ParB/RepB/Spo0J family partition protein [Acetobacteraceae bacterium]|nr:ParB/RepB/Spo0J family partition protein [Acetobacteraceae bacterium]
MPTENGGLTKRELARNERILAAYSPTAPRSKFADVLDVARQPEPIDPGGAHESERRVQYLPSARVDEIAPSAFNPRQSFDEEALAELAADIKLRGVLQPLILRPLPPGADARQPVRFEILAGERRFRAAGIAGLTHVPALVHHGLTDQGALEIALVENLVRRDINPIEAANGFAQLLLGRETTAPRRSCAPGRSRTSATSASASRTRRGRATWPAWPRYPIRPPGWRLFRTILLPRLPAAPAATGPPARTASAPPAALPSRPIPPSRRCSYDRRR